MTNPEMALVLGRTEPALDNMINKLARRGIRRSDATRLEMQSRGYFSKGHKPWNTGVKGLCLSPETQFKKGHKPHNTKFDGCIRIRGKKDGSKRYKWIRIAEGKWVPYHRHIWEEENGPIPKGHLVAFINGDPMDVRLENLELISRAENAHRNQNYDSDGYVAHTLAPRDPELKEELKKHPGLIELKRLQLQHRRAIRNVIREDK
jgi:hypothetical protein